MTVNYKLRLTLLSDATFGRGDGVAGLVDVEVQHDEVGLPFLGGRTLKGLLGAECADLVFALDRARPDQTNHWAAVSERLFGRSGAGLKGQAILRVGAARLADDLRLALLDDVQRERLTPADVLETVTALRRQTAMDEWGVPLENALRTMRVVLRGTVFWASLDFVVDPAPDEQALMVACIKALRRAGTGRNRGTGRLRADLFDTDGRSVTDEMFQNFREAVFS